MLYIADTLSCVAADKTVLIDAENEKFVQAVISQLPVSTNRLYMFPTI